MSALDIADVLEVIEVCQDTLDEVWKQTEHKPYPENRMRHLMGVIGQFWSAIFVIRIVRATVSYG